VAAPEEKSVIAIIIQKIQEGIRSCISVNEYDKCMSSQIYPSQKECMNPILMAK
jgi:hypothetical protein